MRSGLSSVHYNLGIADHGCGPLDMEKYGRPKKLRDSCKAFAFFHTRAAAFRPVKI
jgi:hypothetical protein